MGYYSAADVRSLRLGDKELPSIMAPRLSACQFGRRRRVVALGLASARRLDTSCLCASGGQPENQKERAQVHSPFHTATHW